MVMTLSGLFIIGFKVYCLLLTEVKFHQKWVRWEVIYCFVFFFVPESFLKDFVVLFFLIFMLHAVKLMYIISFLQDGMTALAIAAKEGFVEIVKDLLGKGAYVNVCDRVSTDFLKFCFSISRIYLFIPHTYQMTQPLGVTTALYGKNQRKKIDK